MNRTLLEKARCMRLQAGLPKVFWVDTVDAAGYLVNRSPHTRLDGRLPEEVWSRRTVGIRAIVVRKLFQVREVEDPKCRKFSARYHQGIFYTS